MLRDLFCYRGCSVMDAAWLPCITDAGFRDEAMCLQM